MGFLLVTGEFQTQGTLDRTKSFVKEIKFCAGLPNPRQCGKGGELLLDASELQGVNLFISTHSARESVRMGKVPHK